MELTITISEEDVSKLCTEKVVRIIADHVGSFGYNSTIRDKVYKALSDKTDEIIASSLADVDAIKEKVRSEIERRIRLNITRSLAKTGES